MDFLSLVRKIGIPGELSKPAEVTYGEEIFTFEKKCVSFWRDSGDILSGTLHIFLPDPLNLIPLAEVKEKIIEKQ